MNDATSAKPSGMATVRCVVCGAKHERDTSSTFHCGQCDDCIVRWGYDKAIRDADKAISDGAVELITRWHANNVEQWRQSRGSHALDALSPEQSVAWDRDIAPLLELMPDGVVLVAEANTNSACVVFDGWGRSRSLWVAVQWHAPVWAPTFPLPFHAASRERQLEALFFLRDGGLDELAQKTVRQHP